jgi:epoxyqueuosine reductase/LAO/AO transport system ATPase
MREPFSHAFIVHGGEALRRFAPGRAFERAYTAHDVERDDEKDREHDRGHGERDEHGAVEASASVVERTARVRERARELGFDAVGIARADVPLDRDHAHYRAFVDAGYHGEMGWLAEHGDVRARLDGEGILPGARSVVCVARRYQRPASAEASDPPLAQTIARYARGRDYHNFLKKQLRKLGAFIEALGDELGVPVHTRALSDTAPVLERAWAARAGLGFVGKNGLVIVPGVGSMVLLGEVVTTLELLPDAPMAERCGSCTRCLDACPTDAFVRPFVLDARRCVSYLTIEHRASVPVALREGVGEHLFGCDDCQTVCPFNGTPRGRAPAHEGPFAPHARWGETSLEELLALDEERFAELGRGSPVKRAGRFGLARNAAIVLGNRADARAAPALEEAATHPSPIVREAARWALGRLSAASAEGRDATGADATGADATAAQNEQKTIASGGAPYDTSGDVAMTAPNESSGSVPAQRSFPGMHDLAARVLAKDARAVARALRLVDDRVPGYVELLKALFPSTGNAFVVGVTGNPGAGKSTLCDRLIEGFRKQGKTVGVIAVDPTSPYTGGAILGDRIRMGRHATDAGVFIRSVATRGHLGGLSRSARDMVRVLDAYGVDVVLVETVGVGQDELEITRTAHTTLVVMAPGMGDEVQAIKAGIMECADVFAVNKADRDGADATVRDVELMIALGNDAILALSKVRGHVTHSARDGHVGAGGGGGATGSASSGASGSAAQHDPHHERWTPPILKCVATKNEGIGELVTALERHRSWLEGTERGRSRRRARLGEEVREGLREALIDAATHDLRDALDAAVRDVEGRAADPYTATEKLVAAFRGR